MALRINMSHQNVQGDLAQQADQVAGMVAAQTEIADASAAAGLQQARLVMLAARVCMLRERARLREKYGAQSFQVKAVAERIPQSEALAERYGQRAELLRGQMIANTVGEDRYVYMGRIADEEHRLQPGQKIIARDAQGEVIAATTADEKGNFSLIFETVEEEPSTADRAAAADPDDPATAKVVADDARSGAIDFTVEVVDESGAVERLPQAVKVKPGAATVREILVESKAGAPDPEIRLDPRNVYRTRP